jgi:hypothetical protein
MLCDDSSQGSMSTHVQVSALVTVSQSDANKSLKRVGGYMSGGVANRCQQKLSLDSLSLSLARSLAPPQVLTCPPILSRYYAGMMQDGLRIAGTLWGGGAPPPHASITPP